MQTKAVHLDIKELDLEEGVFEGHAAVFNNVDLGGDVLMPGSMKRSLKNWASSKKALPILWQHNPHEPIGVTVEAEEDDKGLKIKGKLILDVQRAREARALMQAGALGGLSIGYDVVEDNWTKEGVRELHQIRLYEYSPVTWPMNPKAGYTNVKSAVSSLPDLEEIALELTGIRTVAQKNDRPLSARDRKFAQEAIEHLKSLLSVDTEETDSAESHSDSPNEAKGLDTEDINHSDPEAIHSLMEVRSLIAEFRKQIGLND